MFVSAIERATAFTRPIHFITRYYGSTEVHAGAATLFFINSDGWALTCQHVAAELLGADQLLARYTDFKAKRSQTKGQKKEKQLLKELERQSGFLPGVPVEVYWNVMNCIEGQLHARIIPHPTLDIALVHFHGYDRLLCTEFPIFAENDSQLKQGKFLCRLGFPFPEFTNYAYHAALEKIVWTSTGRINTPRFPIEGMVTRHLIKDNAVVGFEMSTPGLRGQSGGPAFDTDARVWGMQAATNHLDLSFDVDADVMRGAKKTRVQDHAFLHVGQCVHVALLKEFMGANGVSFRAG